MLFDLDVTGKKFAIIGNSVKSLVQLIGNVYPNLSL